MADKLTPLARSENMRRIKSKDMKPELVVRRIVHGMGYRYRLHKNGLPGKPDLVFASRRKIIFVHGCFWHGHSSGCRDGRIPKSNLEYWKPKLARNKERDLITIRYLERDGWNVHIVWECETKNLQELKDSLMRFLG